MLGHMIKRAICNKWMVLACTVSIAIIYYEILLGWGTIFHCGHRSESNAVGGTC